LTTKTKQAAPREKRYLSSNQLRERWGGVSHMFLQRRVHEDPRFPKPRKFGGRIRFWLETEIEEYEAACVRLDEKIAEIKRGAA
jgi:predicted DNA-binding transcriptional regulator AlpA